MGTTYNIKYLGSSLVAPAQLQQQVDELLADINRLMSTYIADSELSKYNQWASTQPFPVSAQTLEVLQEAKRLGQLSTGRLDVTVGPLVNLWGFGPKYHPEKIPSPEEIAQAKQNVGFDKLTLGDSWISKSVPQLYVDLSTIAKGYAVDQLADLLARYEIQHYLVEIGGEMRLSGHKASGQPWRIAIEKPITTERAVQKVINIGNNAVATSGNYRIYFEQDGQRYSHLIDPMTGYPIQHKLVSVTVVHASSMTADGLATALNVMGKDQALALAEQLQLAVLLITRENNSFKEYTSEQFNNIVTVL
jgi:thiamine biosynthesis lipoprotein